MSDRRSPRKRLLRPANSDSEDNSDEETGQQQANSSPPNHHNPDLRSSPPAENLVSSPSGDTNDIFANDSDEEVDVDERDAINDIDEMEEELEEATGMDLIGDDMAADYQSNPNKDQYDSSDIDDQEYENLDANERRRVDRLLDARDQLTRGSTANLDLDTGEPAQVEIDEYGLPVQRRRRRNIYDENFDEDNENEINGDYTYEQLADVRAPSTLEWISNPDVTRSIARELKSFLLEYTDDQGKSVYGSRIRTLGELNSETLEVSYQHLLNSKATLADFLRECPEEMLKIFDVVAMEATELHYPDYSQIHSEIHVRITDFSEIFQLRQLREIYLNNLVRVTGVVTRRTGVFPQLKYVKFDCLKCGVVLGPFFQDSNQEVRVQFCTNCQSKGPFKINSEKTVYRNYQRITIQEPPGSIPAGRLPRHKEAILLWDLVDVAKPGEEIDLTGIYKNAYDGALNAKNGFPVFATVIEANCIKRREGATRDMIDDSTTSSPFQWTPEEEKKFRKMSREVDIIDKIISSMAPSIYGHKDIKTAMACSLFSGVPKDVNGKHSIRGDINVLLLGDPGTAKSQILKYVEKTAHRAVFATGQGASAVGLTASVRKDPITKEWTLEGGALVLADKGVCMIDEFDKMNDQDRTSIHEAMEQQSISISKAGIVTTLQARCSIIAAANPIGGRYNASVDLQRNVNLTEPILSRFDIICVVRDLVNPESDERLASFVIDSHMRSYPADIEENDKSDMEIDSNDEELNEEVVRSQRMKKLEKIRKEKESEISPISQETLMKYIQYARIRIHPKLTQMDMDKVSRVYADLRKESNTTGSFPITVRHLESILRIAESFAKMRLSEFVSSSDLDKAIKVVVDSFIGAQKISIRKQLQRSFMKYTLPQRRNRVEVY